jgi:hypothetical protein
MPSNAIRPRPLKAKLMFFVPWVLEKAALIGHHSCRKTRRRLPPDFSGRYPILANLPNPE